MTSAAPQDGGTSTKKNPFEKLSEKLHNSSLHDLKVGFIHKKHGKLEHRARSINVY